MRIIGKKEKDGRERQKYVEEEVLFKSP